MYYSSVQSKMLKSLLQTIFCIDAFNNIYNLPVERTVDFEGILWHTVALVDAELMDGFSSVTVTQVLFCYATFPGKSVHCSGLGVLLAASTV